jgi:hypothetical protein
MRSSRADAGSARHRPSGRAPGGMITTAGGAQAAGGRRPCNATFPVASAHAPTPLPPRGAGTICRFDHAQLVEH